MSKPYVGDHDMEEILRLTGEDVFVGRGRDRGSLRNYRYDSGLSESVQPLDVHTMLEETTPLTDTEVVDLLKAKLAPLLKDRVWSVWTSGNGIVKDAKTVYIDVYSYSHDKKTWVSGILENAPNQLRLTISYWENGVPVTMSNWGKLSPSDGIVELRLVRALGAVRGAKPRQMKGTPAKVVAAISKWFDKNAELFTGAPAAAAESAWRDAFPTVNPVDDFESWAAARDDQNDKTPAGVMGEANDASYAGLVLDLDYNPGSSGGRVTVGGGSLAAQQAVLAAVQQELGAEFGKTDVKRTSGEWSLLVKAGVAKELVAALRRIGKKLGMKLSKSLGEGRAPTLRELAETGGARRSAPLRAVPVTGSPRAMVEDLDRLLKSMRG